MNEHSPLLFVLSIRAWVAFVALFGGVLLSCQEARASQEETRQSTWAPTGPLGTARSGHTATLLPNGKVLVAGGYGNNSALNSTELYDPTTRIWSFTGNLNTARGGHSATLLPNGKVLVAGSYNNSALNSAELYDPATGTWSYTGNLNTAGGVTATLLPNGKVLVVTGNSAELYDPDTGTWSYTGNLNKATSGAATLLPNGKVLVLGGPSPDVRNSAELYDPVTGTWSITDNLNTGRWYAQTATLLSNGMVLVAAGSEGGDDVLESAELYDAVTGTWSKTGDLNEDRGTHTATLLPSGKVLVAGGFDYDYHALNSAELYDPATGSWSYTGSLNSARSGHTATLLTNGDVIVAGGDSGSSLSSVELFPSSAASPPAATADAIEYYHAEFNHYFVTPIADEITQLDAGVFAGWARTGLKFKVYSAATTGASTVCRFFSTGFVPKSSHFYTPSATECALLKTDPGWLFEGNVFYIAVAGADGTCPAGTPPIYRIYNNGQGAAPNHRYTTDSGVRDQMIARGWVIEGNGPGFAFMCESAGALA